MEKEREEKPPQSRKEKRRQNRELIKKRFRERNVRTAIYFILRTLVIAVMIRQLIIGHYGNVFTCVLTLCLFMVPTFIDHKLKIDLPNALEIIIILFIFAAEILGEIQEYYLYYDYWDTMLHTINGFLMAAIGFSLVDIFNRSEHLKFSLSPFFVSVVAFCFSMTVGVLWEFFEFGADMILKTDMQKDTVIDSISSVMLNPDGVNTAVTIDIESVVINGEEWNYGGYIDIGLIDTMKDLIVNFIGAVIFSVIGFFYITGVGKGKFASRLIPTIRQSDEEAAYDKKLEADFKAKEEAENKAKEEQQKKDEEN